MKWMNFFLLLIIIFFTACPGKKCVNNYKILILNNSSTTVYFNYYWNYPDTSIGEYNPLNNGTDGLKMGESFIDGSTQGFCWEDYISKGEKQYIYFFNADTLKTLPWDTIRKTYRGVLRKEFDLNYLTQNNFTITYP